MCGICGIVDFRGIPVEKNKILTMMSIMKHRGPDDEGTYFVDHMGMGFVRLSIIDLSKKGHQPMVSSVYERYILSFNGEIYNYIELRQELSKLGYSFSTRTDTEVLLNSYIEWGENCLDKFNGMWAFVIYDKETKTLFGARDRYGVKPFYYTIDNDRFIYASEIPALISSLKNKPNPDNQAIFDYLVFNRTDHSDFTFFKEVKKIQHGHKFKLRKGKLIIERWYDLKAQTNKSISNPEEFLEIFKSSLNLRLRSDVPLGVCLSGGLDSSSIVSILTKFFSMNDLHTFSAVYGEGKQGDESKFISEYNLPNMHFITPDASALYHDLNSIVRAHGEPIPSTSPYAQFKVMELAHNHVTVTLDGQGADEAMGGYHYFFGLFFKGLLLQGKIGNLTREILAYYKTHQSFFGILTFVYFLLPSFLRTSIRNKKLSYLNTDFYNHYANSNKVSGNIYASQNLHSSLIDHFEYKLEHLLKWEDRNSMWFSLESRVPFLDFRLVENMLSVPENMIINQGMTKQVLRQSMKGILPEPIRVRTDKVGFETPQDEWFREHFFQNLVMDLIHSRSFKQRGLIDPLKADKQFKSYMSQRKNISKEVWKWINLELWFREFID